MNGRSEPPSVIRYSVAGPQDSDVARRSKRRWSAHWKSRPRPSTEFSIKRTPLRDRVAAVLCCEGLADSIELGHHGSEQSGYSK
jgi:hypothetical protein